MIVGVLVIGVWSAGAMAAGASAGKAIFEKSCVSCHGKDGKGNPAMAKVLGEKGLDLTAKDATQKSDEQLLKVIAEGAGKMPAQKSLSKDDQKQVLTYVRSLAK
jgi:cytochrome c6